MIAMKQYGSAYSGSSSIAWPSASRAASSRCADRLGVGVSDGEQRERPAEIGDGLAVVPTLLALHLDHLGEQ